MIHCQVALPMCNCFCLYSVTGQTEAHKVGKQSGGKWHDHVFCKFGWQMNLFVKQADYGWIKMMTMTISSGVMRGMRKPDQ